MPSFKIDNVAMTYQPAYWRVILPEPQDYAAAGYNRVIVQPETPPSLEVRWGQEGTYPALISELKTKRGRDLVHVLSWPDEADLRHKHCNVFFPEIPSGQGPAHSVVDALSLTFRAFNPLPGLVLIDLFRPGVLTVADGVAKWKAPAGGRILDVDGAIGTLGTGAGQTRIQVSNGATDYLTTRGDFVVASGTNLMENQVLDTLPVFDRGDVIELDIDAIPAGVDSANVLVSLYVLLFGV